MKFKQKYKIFKRPIQQTISSSAEEHYSNYMYNSSSFFVRYYAYLPFIHSLKNVDITKRFRILDLGCADGPFLPTLNYYAKNNVAIDISEGLIRGANTLVKEKGNNLSNISLLCSDGHFLPFKNEKFDLIFCLEVLEHVKSPKLVLIDINRVLKKGGTLICTLPVEIGPSLLIRTIIRKLLNFKRPDYSLKEYIRSVILKKPGKRPEYSGFKEYIGEKGHKNFDWRVINKEINNIFENVSIKFIPINRLREINPLVLIKAIKNK